MVSGAFGRFVEFGDRTGHEHPMSVKLVSPRMLLEFARAPEDVLVVYELGLVGLYAGLSKLFRSHKVISLVEGDYRHIGRTGTAYLKVVVRRLAARFVDMFVANNPPAREYLIRTLNVPEDKIIVGWWLAGLPADLAAHPPAAAPDPEGVPLFICVGRLIPQKGTDLVIRALAVYRRRFGPCALWIIGDGPERECLVQLSRRLGVEDAVTFLGMVDHHALKGAFEACRALVFPTLQDFIGRVVVESLSAGAPVVASPMTGAVGTILHDGVNGIVVDPMDTSALAEAMHKVADPETSRALREGVRRTSAELRPDAASQVVLRAVARVRADRPPGVAASQGSGMVHVRSDRGAAAQSEQTPVYELLNLRVGEIVEVRSEAEIMTTLDARGELESLPFMPEMLQFCGRRFSVDKLAVKLCDTIGSTGMYRMRNAVHLAGVRCDGQAHGGCQAGCLIYWKEAWLRRVPADGRDAVTAGAGTNRGSLHTHRAGSGDPQDRDVRGGGAVRVPGDRAAPRGADAHPRLGRQAVRPRRAVGQHGRGRRGPCGRHRGVQRVPGLQPEVRAEAATDPRRRAVSVHRRDAGDDTRQHPRPAAGRARADQEQGGDRPDARREQQHPRTVVRPRDGGVLRTTGASAAPGRAGRRRADRPAAVAEASLHRPGGRDLPWSVPSVLPSRRLSLLAGGMARAGRVEVGAMPRPMRDLRTLAGLVRERGLRHTGRVSALAVRGRWMAAADRRREAAFGVSSDGAVDVAGR